MSGQRSDETCGPAHCGIAVMGKASIPGRAKTRLVPPLSYAEAAQFNTAFLQDVTGNIAQAARQADIAAYVAYGPPGSEAFFREHLPVGVGLVETWLPDFGDCLFKAITDLFAAGHQAACVLNSDSPTLPTALLVQAAQALAAPGDRAVLGPCDDGGYYFLGLKQAHRRLFDEIDWSTERVAGQTRQRAAELGLELVLLDSWYDVDDAAALRMLHGELFEHRAFCTLGPGSFAAPQTHRLFAEQLAQTDLALRLGLAPAHQTARIAR